MPTSRHRVLDRTYGMTGTYQTFPPFPSITVQTAVAGIKKTCDDQICAPREKRMPQTLLLVTTESRFPSFNGVYPMVGTPIKQLINCPTDYKPSPPSTISKFPVLTTIEQSSLAWSSLAATNPNVAHVSLPTFTAELKDLPELFRTWGNKRIREANRLWDQLSHHIGVVESDLRQIVTLSQFKTLSANLRRLINARESLRFLKNPLSAEAIADLCTFVPKFNIWYQWGWSPLVSDIRSMFSFTEAVNQRIRWLANLQTGKRVIRRRATLRNASDRDSPTTIQLKSVGANIQGRRTVFYTEKVWCTVEWKLDPSFSLSGVGLKGDPLWRKARELTFGWTTQDALTALWEIIPWSWFVDWFLHVQTVMDATKNTVPLTWGPISLMRHTRATALVTPLASSTDLSWCRMDSQHLQTEDRKQRLQVSPILPFAPSFMPVFTTGQWSILGSLAFLKIAGR